MVLYRQNIKIIISNVKWCMKIIEILSYVYSEKQLTGVKSFGSLAAMALDSVSPAVGNWKTWAQRSPWFLIWRGHVTNEFKVITGQLLLVSSKKDNKNNCTSTFSDLILVCTKVYVHHYPRKLSLRTSIKGLPMPCLRMHANVAVLMEGAQQRHGTQSSQSAVGYSRKCKANTTRPLHKAITMQSLSDSQRLPFFSISQSFPTLFLKLSGFVGYSVALPGLALRSIPKAHLRPAQSISWLWVHCRPPDASREGAHTPDLASAMFQFGASPSKGSSLRLLQKAMA